MTRSMRWVLPCLVGMDGHRHTPDLPVVALYIASSLADRWYQVTDARIVPLRRLN